MKLFDTEDRFIKLWKMYFVIFFKIHVISNTIGRKRLKQERMDESIYQAFVDFERRKPSSTPSLFNFLITQFWRANKAPLILYPLCLLLPVSYQASSFYETDHYLAPEEMGGRGGCVIIKSTWFPPFLKGSVGF